MSEPVTVPVASVVATAPRGTVLFATIAAGGGHVATATALAQAVERESEGRFQTKVSDAMAEYGAQSLDRRHKRAWRQMLARPQLVRAGQRLTDAVPAVTRTLQNALLDAFSKRVADALNVEAPELIVVNHGWLASAFTRARSRFGLTCKVVVFATEPFDASALWSTPEAETVLAPSAAARSDLIDLGVPASRVVVSGYPVGRRFLETPERERARARLGLGDGFTCLVSLGAEGVSGEGAFDAVRRLLARGVNVIAVCGRNEQLLARLKALARSEDLTAPGTHRLPAADGGHLLVRGFANDMELLLAACDLVAGKAGPASTMEALAVKRPVLAATYAGLNELAVVRFLESYGLGGFTNGFAGLPDAVLAWRHDEARRTVAARAAAGFDFEAMLTGLGRYLADLAAAGSAANPVEGSAAASTTLLRTGGLEAVTRERLALGASRGPGTAAANERRA